MHYPRNKGQRLIDGSADAKQVLAQPWYHAVLAAMQSVWLVAAECVRSFTVATATHDCIKAASRHVARRLPQFHQLLGHQHRSGTS